MNAIAARRKEVVLQRGRSEISVDDMDGLVVCFADPFGELHSVGNGSGEKDVADCVREQDDGFFPNDTSLCTGRL